MARHHQVLRREAARLPQRLREEKAGILRRPQGREDLERTEPHGAVEGAGGRIGRELDLGRQRLHGEELDAFAEQPALGGDEERFADPAAMMRGADRHHMDLGRGRVHPPQHRETDRLGAVAGDQHRLALRHRDIMRERVGEAEPVRQLVEDRVADRAAAFRRRLDRDRDIGAGRAGSSRDAVLPRAHPVQARAPRCSSTRVAMPLRASPKSCAKSSAENGFCSAVPWISTISPLPVSTKLASASAFESSA